MQNNKIKRGILPILALLLLINSCNLFEKSIEDSQGIAIAGTWESISSFGTSKIEISNTVFKSFWNDELSYEGKIINFKNGKLNANSTTVNLTDFGYFTVLYNGGTGDSKYGIIRWKSLKTEGNITTMSYSEGYKNKIYYTSAEEAEAGMDDSFFGTYSSITKK